ncbi:MAG: hypothetical protein ACRYFX_05855 [Janthinobacterium lividum]
MPYPAMPTGSNPALILSLAITLSSFLLVLVGWFIVRTLNKVEDAIKEGKAETTALRTELGTVTANLKDYAGKVERQHEELTALKKAYATLERAFQVLDRWIYGQHLLGKLPEPPTIHLIQPE